MTKIQKEEVLVNQIILVLQKNKNINSRFNQVEIITRKNKEKIRKIRVLNISITKLYNYQNNIKEKYKNKNKLLFQIKFRML